jgi:hypothetical protein
MKKYALMSLLFLALFLMSFYVSLLVSERTISLNDVLLGLNLFSIISVMLFLITKVRIESYNRNEIERIKKWSDVVADRLIAYRSELDLLLKKKSKK